MNSFIEESIEEASKASTRCKFASWIATVPEADRSEINEALHHPGVEVASLLRVIERRYGPIGIGRTSVLRHRRAVTGQNGDTCPCR